MKFLSALDYPIGTRFVSRWGSDKKAYTFIVIKGKYLREESANLIFDEGMARMFLKNAEFYLCDSPEGILYQL